VPAVEGAVYRPEVEMVPPVADQVTAVFVEPLTLAVNCLVPPVAKEAEIGLMATEITDEEEDVTVTVAEADFVVSAELFAVTV
jgi:hypothetical protein